MLRICIAWLSYPPNSGPRFRLCPWKEDSQSDETLDEDDANLDPGTRQRVRMKKTWKYFTETACFAPLALCIS